MNEKEYIGLVKAVRSDLFRFAVRYTADEGRAWDVVHDAFEALWTRREGVEAAKGKGWLVRVMYRQMVDQHRREERLRALMPELVREEAYRQHEGFELHDAMQRALATLTEQQRAILLMKDVEGYRYDEIAEIAQLEVPQVTGILYRARVNLKKAYLKLNNNRYDK